MMKYLLSSTIGIVLSVSCMSCLAQSNLPSIVKNTDVDTCTEKSGGINGECLSLLSKRTEKALNDEYQRKLKEISTFDFSQCWMGQKEQREEMKTSFINSQNVWLKYRQDYCKAASAGAEGIDGYSAVLLSCQINMGSRRIEEIRMIHPDLSDG